MLLKYIGQPGAYVDIDCRIKWNPNEIKEVPTQADAHRLLGTGLFQIVPPLEKSSLPLEDIDEMHSTDKMDRPRRRK